MMRCEVNNMPMLQKHPIYFANNQGSIRGISPCVIFLIRFSNMFHQVPSPKSSFTLISSGYMYFSFFFVSDISLM